VIGGALTLEPVLNCHNCFPVSWSSAMNSPVSLPVNSKPPSVANVPAEAAKKDRRINSPLKLGRLAGALQSEA